MGSSSSTSGWGDSINPHLAHCALIPLLCDIPITSHCAHSDSITLITEEAWVDIKSSLLGCADCIALVCDPNYYTTMLVCGDSITLIT